MVLKVYIDGASRKNPGNAGAGVYIEDGKGDVVAELKEYLGITTNNEAEYKALIFALKYITDTIMRASGRVQTPLTEPVKEVSIFSDSQLLVNQMNGEYSVKSPNIIPLYKEAKKILNDMPLYHEADRSSDVLSRALFTFTHIPRELNKQADRLANRAIDEA